MYPRVVWFPLFAPFLAQCGGGHLQPLVFRAPTTASSRAPSAADCMGWCRRSGQRPGLLYEVPASLHLGGTLDDSAACLSLRVLLCDTRRALMVGTA